jgi:hypothetical protein
VNSSKNQEIFRNLLKKEKQLIKSFIVKMIEKIRKTNNSAIPGSGAQPQKINTGECNSPNQDKRSMKSKYLNSQV